MSSIVYQNGIKQDPNTFSEGSSLIFIDGGARVGELYPDENGKGVYFEVDKENNCLKVRDDLGKHVDYSFMPFPFTVNQKYFAFAEIHMFEPNPEFLEELEKKAKFISKLNCIVWIHQIAIGTSTQDITLRLTDGGWGSTICPDKQNETFIDEITVKQCDFVGFVNAMNNRCENTELSPEIHLKLDIEGAEYDVLKRMFSAWYPPCSAVKSLSVEFHKDFYPDKHDKWVADHWHAILSLMKNNVAFNWWPGEW